MIKVSPTFVKIWSSLYLFFILVNKSFVFIGETCDISLTLIKSPWQIRDNLVIDTFIFFSSTSTSAMTSFLNLSFAIKF